VTAATELFAAMAMVMMAMAMMTVTRVAGERQQGQWGTLYFCSG
jgi:hypothetical protein